MLHTYESGESTATPIVFLHGAGLSGRMWQPQFERLPEFYCLAPDLPEHGKSLDVRLTLKNTAQMVAEIIQTKVPGKRTHLVGLSLGGAIALTMLRLTPEVIDHTIISGSSAGMGNILGAITKGSGSFYRYIKKERLVKMMVQQFKIPAEYHEMVAEDVLPTLNTESNNHLVDALMALKLPERVPGPMLAVVGEKETIPAHYAARKLATAIQGATGAVVKRVGHVWNLQAPDLFADTVRAWLTDSPLPEQVGPMQRKESKS
jgi:pimeloyl-ACP methyl ester carboxylesterase